MDNIDNNNKHTGFGPNDESESRRPCGNTREIFDASSPDVKLQDEQPIFQHNYDRIPGQPDVCACNAANCVRYRDGSDASAAAVWYGANHGHKL